MSIIRVFLALVMSALVGIGAASAQDYSVRVTHNTNLRAAASLQARIVETAPAGTTLPVTGSAGRWLQINRNGNQVWMASWVSYSRVQGVQQTVAPPQTPIDNCCFVDRQCNTDQEWTDGYWAFQNGQCAAPAQTRPQVQPQIQPQIQSPTQPLTRTPTQGDIPDDINNCCHLDRECHSEEEWRAGYVAFKELECWDEYHAWYRTPDPNYMPAAGSNNCCTAPGWICLNNQQFNAGSTAFQTYGHCAPRIRASYLPSHAAIDNCCHVGRQCTTDADWENGYLDWHRGACLAEVNNCCYTDWECHTEEDWQSGFIGWQSGTCAEIDQGQASTQPVTTTPVTTTPITGPIPEGVDNCCFLNMQCHSDQDYVSGYERFKYNLCHVSSVEGGIKIEGSGAFRGRIKEALQMLLDRVPRWYVYVTSGSGLHVIRERPGRAASVTSRIGVMKVDAFYYAVFDLAAVIVHEACHAHRYSDGLESGGYHGERDCTEKEVEVLRVLGPGSPQLQHELWLLDNMHKTENQWWHD